MPNPDKTIAFSDQLRSDNRVWQCLRANRLSNRVDPDYEPTIDAA